MRYLVVIISVFVAGLVEAKAAEKDSLQTDSAIYFDQVSGFIDSMRTDSLRKVLFDRFSFHIPTQTTGRKVDPLDPFNQEVFLRRGLGRFWFFLVSMIVLGLIIYFRSAFPNQLLLRLRSLFNGYYFRELIADFGISFTSGSVVAAVISTLILAQAIVVVVVYAGYVNLNSVVFYLLVVFAVIVWRVLLYMAQRLQAYVLDLQAISRNQTQRQINIDFGISLILFPVITLIYFNSSYLQDVNVSLIMASAITSWFTLRVILEFMGLFRESGISFSGILYFCGFEILPHAVLLTALFRLYNT